MGSSKVALILGGSGETGKSLLSQLLSSPGYTKVVSLGRREVALPSPDPQGKVLQQTIDFDNLEASRELFRGVDSAFICLGTTRAKAGPQGFVKVDHDYVVGAAQLLREEGCPDLHLLTSSGSNPNSMFLYPETKGRAEESVTKLGFPYLAIYRPRLLLCDRGPARRLMEQVLQWTAQALDPWSWWSVPVEKVAGAMLSVSLRQQGDRQGRQVFEHKEIIQITEQ